MPEAVRELVKNRRLGAVAVAIALIAYPLLLPVPTASTDLLLIFVCELDLLNYNRRHSEVKRICD